jgi:hypothetical protein
MEKVFTVKNDKKIKEITKESHMFMVEFQCCQKIRAIQMWGDFCVTDGTDTVYGQCGDYLIFKDKFFTNHQNRGFEIISKKVFEDEYERVE